LHYIDAFTKHISFFWLVENLVVFEVKNPQNPKQINLKFCSKYRQPLSVGLPAMSILFLHNVLSTLNLASRKKNKKPAPSTKTTEDQKSGTQSCKVWILFQFSSKTLFHEKTGGRLSLKSRLSSHVIGIKLIYFHKKKKLLQS